MDNYPKTITKSKETQNLPHPFKRFLRYVFVKNIGYKLTAIVVAASLWVLAVAFL